ncbi:MAG: hypothetical protein IJ146_14055 [Kiritimatiellae bacterium]|nr:hypothetical protein [Kiritimatiellia bacterium]
MAGEMWFDGDVFREQCSRVLSISMALRECPADFNSPEKKSFTPCNNSPNNDKMFIGFGRFSVPEADRSNGKKESTDSCTACGGGVFACFRGF